MGAEGQSEDFVISRVLDAPRERVWTALTDLEHMRQWWAPPTFTLIASTMDLRVGGVFHCGMKSFEGYKMWAKFIYREIAPPERVVFINSFSNPAGDAVRHPIVPTWPLETLTTVTLKDEPGDKTEVNVRWSAHNPSEVERKTFDSAHVGMRATWANTLDRLAAYLTTAN
jgi:uncharacterized protein YndB with AHSA1/START domain